MAYTIKFKDNQYDLRNKVLAYLAERIAKEGVFTATLTPRTVYATKKNHPIIVVKPVRLLKKKPYCGQHFGECIVNPFIGVQKKKNMTILEWEDWIKFHGLVNRVLNKFHADADVWTTPLECRGKFFIRKGKSARKRFDVDENWSTGQRVQTWNTGTSDQF
jgi:hypothetical protein